MAIVGVSFNSPTRNLEWHQAQGYPFELWSDQDRALALAYGAVSTRLAPFPSRVTVILDAEGREVLRYDDVEVGTHPADVLEDCKALFGK